LQRHFAGQLWGLNKFLKTRQPTPNGPVFWQNPSRLAHEPNRRSGRILSGENPKEQIVFDGHGEGNNKGEVRFAIRALKRSALSAKS
jgi:hypothetical protein